jgi:hypothetical protein
VHRRFSGVIPHRPYTYASVSVQIKRNLSVYAARLPVRSLRKKPDILVMYKPWVYT